MFAKCMTAGLFASTILATAAFAPSAAPTTTAPAATPAPVAASDMSFTGNWRASKIVGLNVYNDKNESLGSINDLLTDKSGNIKAVVLGVGGFLGVGEHLVAVPFDKVKFVNEPVAYSGTAGGATSTGTGSRPSTTTGAAGSSTGSTSTSTSKPNPWYPDHAVFNATKDELKAMPEFKYST